MSTVKVNTIVIKRVYQQLAEEFHSTDSELAKATLMTIRKQIKWACTASNGSSVEQKLIAVMRGLSNKRNAISRTYHARISRAIECL